MKAIGLLVVCVCTVGGCTRSIRFTLPSAPLTLSLTVKGASAKRCTISPGSEQYKALSTWLIAHQDGWQSSVATYAPSVVVTGNGFNLNFLQSLAVLNHAGNQFTHPVSQGDFAFLVCAGNP